MLCIANRQKERVRYQKAGVYFFKYFRILFGFIKSICDTCNPKMKTEMKPYANNIQRLTTMGNALFCDVSGYWPGKS